MTDKIVLNPRQLALIASPACNLVLSRLHGLGHVSATELATSIGKSPSTTLYHLRRLEAVGLATVIEKRATVRRPETIYAPAARRIELPDSDPEGLITRAVLAGLRVAMRGYACAPKGEFSHVVRATIRLSPDDAREFTGMLDAANRFAAERNLAEGGAPLHWSSIVYSEA